MDLFDSILSHLSYVTSLSLLVHRSSTSFIFPVSISHAYHAYHTLPRLRDHQSSRAWCLSINHVSSFVTSQWFASVYSFGVSLCPCEALHISYTRRDIYLYMAGDPKNPSFECPSICLLSMQSTIKTILKASTPMRERVSIRETTIYDRVEANRHGCQSGLATNGRAERPTTNP